MARQTILVVEDSPPNLEFIEALLKDQDYEVVRATDGVAALEAARTRCPDLILLDIQIPRMDGEELARRLRADPATRRIPLVALTACAMTGDRERILAMGFDAYIPKPIDVQGFLGEVQRHLRTGEPAGAS
jgi:CheY-like chemotaxis protein